MTAPPPLRAVPLMMGISGRSGGASSGPSFSETGSTPLGRLAAAPLPLNRTLGRLGAGSWMRLAMERTSALLATEQAARSSRQQEKPQRQKAAADSYFAGGAQEESIALTSKAVGPLPPPEALGELPSEAQTKNKTKRKKRSRNQANDYSEEQQAESAPPGENSKGQVFRVPVEGPSQGLPSEASGNDKTAVSKRARKKDGDETSIRPMKGSSISDEAAGAAAASTAAAATAANPVVARTTTEAPEHQEDVEEAVASSKGSAGVSGSSSGIKNNVGSQDGVQGVLRRRLRRPKKAAPQRASAADDDQGILLSPEYKADSSSTAALASRGGSTKQGPRGEAQEEARSVGPPFGRPSPGGPPSGDFSFVVGLIGGLAVPTSATPGATAASEGRQQQEGNEGERRKPLKAHGKRRDEQEGAALPLACETSLVGLAVNSRGPHDSREHQHQQRHRRHAQQQQRREQQEQAQEDQQRERRRERRRRRRQRDSESFRHSCLEGLVDEAPAKAASTQGADEGAPACGVASRTIMTSSSGGALGTSVGVQAELDPCHCFPSVWAADAAAAKRKANIAEKRRLLRLLGAPEACPLEGLRCEGPTGAHLSRFEGERALLKRLWLPAALAAWEGGGQQEATGGDKGGGSFWEEGPLSSSSESPVASPLRVLPEAPATGPVLNPRYVSFGGDTTCSLFSAAGGTHPFCGTAAAAAAATAAAAAAPSTGDPLSLQTSRGASNGDAARLLRVLRRTHRRLVMGGQSAVLRSDSSSEEEVSSREPSPAAASLDEAAVATATVPAAAAAAAAPTTVALPASPRVTPTEGFSARDCLQLKHKTCEVAASLQGPFIRRPRRSAPAAVGWLGDNCWSPSTGSRSSGGKEEKEVAPSSSTSNNSSGTLLPTDPVAGPICSRGGDFEAQSVWGPSRSQRGEPLEVAVTPAGVRASRAAGGSASAEGTDALTPLLMEAPTIANPWKPLDTHPQLEQQQHQQEQHHQMLQPPHQHEQHKQEHKQHQQAQQPHQQEQKQKHQEHHQEEQLHHQEHQQQQQQQEQQEQQEHAEDARQEVTTPSMCAVIRKGLRGSAGGPEAVSSPAGPHHLKRAVSASPLPPANLLSSPIIGEEASFNVGPVQDVLSQEGNPAAGGSLFREAAEPAETLHNLHAHARTRGFTQAEGPQLELGEGELYARRVASPLHDKAAEGGVAASAAAEQRGGWWEELVAEGVEVALSDVDSLEVRALVGYTKSPPSPRLSPFVASVPESDADSLPPQASSPVLLHHDLEHELQQEEERMCEVNENVSLQQQSQQQHDLDTGFRKDEEEGHAKRSVWNCNSKITSEASHEASRTPCALWFRSLGERRLEEHRVANVPRVSRCGLLSAEEAELARRLMGGPLEGPPKVRYGIPLSWRTLAAVGGGGLLDDEAVNLYFALLQERNNRALVCGEMVPRCLLLPSHFHSFLAARGFAAIRRWTLRGNVDLFSHDLLLLPVYVAARAHWALGCVLIRHKVILYLDSLRQDDDAIRFFGLMQRYLLAEHLDKKGAPFPAASSWRGVIPHGLPQQSNAVDCGVFCCCLAEHLSDGRSLPSTLSPDTIESLRLHMVLQLHRGVVE
ncbi:hypothetical protein Esti_002434 [Eimeria stiedai]